jgi:hypothetical protein
MAKTPASTKVAATSGQGVSRLAYQKAYALGKEGGVLPGAKTPKVSGGQVTSGRNDYAKTSLSKAPSGSKSETYDANVEMGKPPKSGVSLKKAAAQKYEQPKEDSGFLKGKTK